MAYYFTVRDKKEYKPLEIHKSELFQRLSRFKGASYSLEEIDKFTINFPNEVSLRVYLNEIGVLSASDINREITVRQKIKGELRKVKYSIIYEDMAKYLDFDYLRNQILARSGDIDFLKKLTSYYRNSACGSFSINSIISFLFDRYDGIVDINKLLDDFLFAEVCKVNYEDGSCVLKYKSLHDFGMFLYNYISKEEKSLKSNLDGQISFEDEMPKKKVKTKSNREIDGQTSFF